MVNMKTLLFLTICTTVLITFSTAMASIQRISIQQTSSQGSSVRQTSIQTDSGQTSEIAINIDSANLGQSHILSISPPRRIQLIGEITINGKLVKKLNNEKVALDLSRFLSPGKQIINISGSYKPEESSIQVEFLGPGTQVSQQIGGSGKLSQTLIVDVH